MRTQVGIIGAGPAGLLLAQLLHLAGIDSVVLEARDEAYALSRIRAGLLEQGSVEVLTQAGLGDRLHREGLVHEGLELRVRGIPHRIPLTELTGRRVTIYGQQEAVKDMIAARRASGRPLLFEAEALAITDIDTPHPAIRFRHQGQERLLHCDVIAGCDGFHGPARAALPPGLLKTYEKVYPFGWFGILAEAPPASHELIYARHDRGFALATMRSPTLSRLYFQCPPDTDVNAWSDDRIWAEFHARFARQDGVGQIHEGRIINKGVAPLRSFVAEPMRHGRLFLAGDAAHIVPPTGAKGMNLAVADVLVLSRAIIAEARGQGSALLDAYSATALDRVWKAERFSWWMTALLHPGLEDDAFQERLRLAELDYVCSSAAARTVLAENYVGLPLP